VADPGWYVYGVVDAEREAPADGPLELVRRPPLAAVVAPVDLSEFDDLDERLNDRAWLERLALAHEDVLRAVAVGGAVVPFRFGALYRRREDVELMLDERRAELVADLGRVRGCVELGVKGYVDRTALEELLGRERAAAQDAAPGRAYLERRRAERVVAAEAGELVGDAARAAHERLLERAVAGVLNRPHSRELSGRNDDMFLNGAYLVRAGDDAIAHEVDALGRAYETLRVTFELTGPWPPYNFVGREQPEEAVR